MGLSPTVMQLILKIKHQGLTLMYFCGHFVLFNGPNREDFSIISIFGAIFGQNLGI